MKYEITNNNGVYYIYRITDYSYSCVKSFKTLKGAENWVKKHS